MKDNQGKLIKRDRKASTARMGGRKTKTDAELWERRIKAYKLWTSGITLHEGARSLCISATQFQIDIKAMAYIQPIQEVKARLDGGYLGLLKTCWDIINAPGSKTESRIAAIKEAREIISKSARLHGLERDAAPTFNNSLTMISTGKTNYDSWDDNAVKAEFDRRRLKLPA